MGMCPNFESAPSSSILACSVSVITFRFEPSNRRGVMKIQINGTNRAYRFEGMEKEQILFSGLRNGVDLPYECSTGTCGTCKAKLIEGKIYDPWPEAPGHKYVKQEQGEFLMCQCIARTDITVEVGSFVYAMDPGACLPRSCFGVIQRADLLTQDVMFLEIELDR